MCFYKGLSQYTRMKTIFDILLTCKVTDEMNIETKLLKAL